MKEGLQSIKEKLTNEQNHRGLAYYLQRSSDPENVVQAERNGSLAAL